MLCYALHGRLSAELQATNNVFQSCYKMDFWPAGAIMAEDQVDGWLAGDGREMVGDKSGRCHCSGSAAV